MIVRSGEKKKANSLIYVLVNWQKSNLTLAYELSKSERTIEEYRQELRTRHDLEDRRKNSYD